MTQKNQPRPYTIPLKIDGIVEKNYEEMKKKSSSCSEGCPFYGYIVEQSSKEEIPLDLQGRCSVNHPDLMGNDTYIRLHVQGCAALKDPACYLSANHEGIRRGSHLRSPRISVEDKENCPIYQRIISILKRETELQLKTNYRGK